MIQLVVMMEAEDLWPGVKLNNTGLGTLPDQYVLGGIFYLSCMSH